MKKSITHLMLTVVLISSVFVSCKKKEEAAPASAATATTPPPATPSTASFTWQENGGAVITADSSFWTTGNWGTGLRAYKGGMANFFEINWSTPTNTSVGSKPLNVGYDFTFYKGADTYTISSDQTLNITAFTGNAISGNFNVTVAGGAITTISANFQNLPFK